jgi:hypothetical protein
MFSVDISRQSPPPLRYSVPNLQRLANKVLFRYCGGLKTGQNLASKGLKSREKCHFWHGKPQNSSFLAFFDVVASNLTLWHLWRPRNILLRALKAWKLPFRGLENRQKLVTGVKICRYEFYTVWRSHDDLRRGALVRLSCKQRMEKLRGPRLFEREWIFLHLRLFVCVSTLLRQISSLGSKKKKMYM